MSLERIAEINNRVSDIIQRFDPAAPATGPAAAQRQESASPSGPRLFDREVEEIIREQAARHGVSERLVKAVVQAESAGNPGAVSPAGAVGLMQLMPGTAKALGVDPHNTEQNVDGGIRYLKDMARQFDSLDDVLAAYNAGPGAVQRHRGVPPYKETQDYVNKIRRSLAQWDA